MSANVIAIDGPAASGKSTIAGRLAKSLGAAYVSTGAMYRAVTWQALQKRMSLENPSENDFDPLLATLDMRYAPDASGNYALSLDGRFLDAELHTPEVSACVSRVAALPNVRSAMKKLQRAMAGSVSIVMEGRDIGTCVFPDAKIKFFLTASPLVRAKRRLAQGGELPDGATVESVAKEIAARDELDSKRPISPLKKADDAILVDSSKFTVEETLATMLSEIKRRCLMDTRISYRVPYADTDKMGVVYYANYLVYFERLRNELLREAGLPYLELEKTGLALPVVEAVCHYKGPARYDDLLELSGCIDEVKGARVKIVCAVSRDGELLVEGHTIHACVNKDGRPIRAPKEILALARPASQP